MGIPASTRSGIGRLVELAYLSKVSGRGVLARMGNYGIGSPRHPKISSLLRSKTKLIWLQSDRKIACVLDHVCPLPVGLVQAISSWCFTLMNPDERLHFPIYHILFLSSLLCAWRSISTNSCAEINVLVLNVPHDSCFSCCCHCCYGWNRVT